MLSNSPPKAEDIIELAKQYLGYPYVYGASGPDAFDCEGFVAYIYDLAGISMPDNSYDNYGTKINNRLDLRAGDIVFFDTVFADGNLADHVGIYIGSGKFIHVDTSLSARKVVIDSMTEDNGWYTARFLWGIRIIEPNS
jgi:cell wall-associated NlpC family hydrolase